MFTEKRKIFANNEAKLKSCFWGDLLKHLNVNVSLSWAINKAGQKVIQKENIQFFVWLIISLNNASTLHLLSSSLRFTIISIIIVYHCKKSIMSLSYHALLKRLHITFSRNINLLVWHS